MCPVTAFIAATVAAIGSAIASFTAALGLSGILSTSIIGSLTVGKLLLIGATMIASQLLASKAPNAATNQGQELTLKLDPTMPRQIAVGTVATGGSNAYSFTYSPLPTDAPNQFLVRVVVLSDAAIQGVLKIMEGTTELLFDGDLYVMNTFPGTFLAGCQTHKDKQGHYHLWVHVHIAGSSNTDAINWLTAHEPNGLWDSTHVGTGVTYAIIQLQWDDQGDAFPNGEPQLTWILEGAPLYDQRYDSTRSSPTRTGSQRLATSSTWEFNPAANVWAGSNQAGGNTAVIIQQLLRGFYTNGVLIIGAQAEDRDLDDNMLLNAYNNCDISQAVTFPYDYASHTTEPLYRSGYLLTASQTTLQMLQDLTAAMDGEIYDRGGNITILPGVAPTPIMSLDDNDVDWTQEASWQPEADLSALYNTITGSYVSLADFFSAKPYPNVTNSTYITQDGGERMVLQQDFNAVNSDVQIQYITQRLLNKSRYQGVIAFVGPLWLLELEQGDWFTFTSTRWGFTSKIFEVVQANPAADMRCALIGIERDPSIDDFTGDIKLTTSTGSKSPPPALIVMGPPTNLQVVAGSNYHLSWTNPPQSIFKQAAVFRGTTTTFSAAVLQIAITGIPGSNMAWDDPVTTGTYYWWVQVWATDGQVTQVGPVTLVDLTTLTSACSGTVYPLLELNFKTGLYFNGSAFITDSAMLSDTAAILGGSGLDCGFYNDSGSASPSTNFATPLSVIDPTFLGLLGDLSSFAMRIVYTMPVATTTDINLEVHIANVDESRYFSSTLLGGPSNSDQIYGEVTDLDTLGGTYVGDTGSSVDTGTVIFTFQRTPSGDSVSNNTATTPATPTVAGTLRGTAFSQFYIRGTVGSYGTDDMFIEDIAIYPVLDPVCILAFWPPSIAAPLLAGVWDIASDPVFTITPPGGEDHLRVWRNTSNSFSGATDISGSLIAGSTTFTDTTAGRSGTQYWWWCVAYGDVGETYSGVSEWCDGLYNDFNITGDTVQEFDAFGSIFPTHHPLTFGDVDGGVYNWEISVIDITSFTAGIAAGGPGSPGQLVFQINITLADGVTFLAGGSDLIGSHGGINHDRVQFVSNVSGGPFSMSGPYSNTKFLSGTAIGAKVDLCLEPIDGFGQSNCWGNSGTGTGGMSGPAVATGCDATITIAYMHSF